MIFILTFAYLMLVNVVTAVPICNCVGNIADPRDCTRYYRCESSGKAIHKVCPYGLRFNGVVGACDRPKNVNCFSDKVFYHFTVSYGNIAPDNYLQQAILINGQFPGPEIRVKKHDILYVCVTNLLDHGFSMHYHGIYQKRTQRSDGAAHITQELIPINGSYLYVMDIGDQCGTYLYHAHTKLDLIWAFAPLVINDMDIISMNKAYFYDEEILIFLSQCYHIPISDIYDGVVGSPFGGIPRASSILINGRSYGIWNTSNPDVRSHGYRVFNVKPNKTYRIRVIGFGDESMLTFTIPNHRLTIIEVDGFIVDPVVTDRLQINPGQRYSVLVKMDQIPGNYIIKSEQMPGPGPDNGVAILHYKGAEDPTPLRKVARMGQTVRLALTNWVLPLLHPSTLVRQKLAYKVPINYDREIIIKSLQRNINGYTKFTVNDIVFENPNVNFLKQIQDGIDISDHPGVYEIRLGQKVQIVFQNSYSDRGICIQHPWHAHGHTFYIVGEGPDQYNYTLAKPIIDENIRRNRVQFRDVLTLFPNRSDNQTGTGVPCGWIAIRFIANNPGAWAVHCHLTIHFIMGKQFVLYEHC